MKKIFLLFLSLALIAVFAACGAGETPGTVPISLAASEVSGAEAIPVAFDAYAQIVELLSRQPGIGAGYDVESVLTMDMRMMVAGMPPTNATTISTSRERVNIDGNLVQTISTSESVTETTMGDFTETEESAMSLYFETYGPEVTFFHAVMDGQVLTDPIFLEILDIVPDVFIPNITREGVLSAEVERTRNETRISLLVDGQQHEEFSAAMLGGLMEMDVMAALGIEFHIVLGDIGIVIVLNNAEKLSRMEIDMTVAMAMHFDGMDMSVFANGTTIHTFNHIGSMELNMPGR